MTSEIDQVIAEAKAKEAVWKKEIEEMRKKSFSTICVHGAYTQEESIRNNNSAVIEPVFSSSAQSLKNSYWLEAAMSYKIPAWGYSRIANPTIAYLELVLSMLESYKQPFSASACCTSSGMAAIKAATEPFLVNLKNKDNQKMNFVSMAQVYGGTFQLFNERYAKERGIEVRWIKDPTNFEEWRSNIDENTRFVYGEMPSNPGLQIFDIKKVAELSHNFEIPLIVDSTIATPVLLRPLEHGADIVIHSLTKSITSSGRVIGGAIISKENIKCKFLTVEQKKDFAGWIKLWPARDSGACLSSEAAAHVIDEIKTLRMRMNQLSKAALEIAAFLEKHEKVEKVNYLGLESNSLHSLAKQYMYLVDSNKNRYGHLLSFTVKGGLEETRKVFDKLKIIFKATDLGRIKSIATIPSISTHQQQGEDARKLASIPDNLIRLCVGAENPQDLINDLDNALKN